MIRLERYNATGNTFIVVDCTDKTLSDEEKSQIVIEGVGNRDGMIFVEMNGNIYHMDYFNRDGKRATFCGNGARTFVKYLKDFYSLSSDLTFSTNAGMLKARISKTSDKISVQMPYPKYKGELVYNEYKGVLIEVGVPHLVIKVENVDKIEVEKLAPEIRYKFDANVNFFEILKQNTLKIRTYERGVEKETLSCGSGITSTAYYYKFFVTENLTIPDKVNIQAKGGELSVIFYYDEVFLEGGVVHG